MGGPAEIPGTLKIVTIWCLIALVLFLGFSAYQHQRSQPEFVTAPGGSSSVSLRAGRDGHYRLEGRINGEAVSFLVDTGASMTSIPADLARRLELPVHSNGRFGTANGEVTADIVIADLLIAESIEIRRLRVAAMPSMQREALLGMDVLGKFRLQQEAGVLKLVAPSPASR